jgi:aspartate aminotransferase
MISKRVNEIAFSGTMNIAGKTIEMQSKGIDVINLCVGEPDLNSPDHIKKAGINAINTNKTKYSLNTGIRELRDAISNKFKTEYGADYSSDEIIVSNGAKQSCYNAIQTVIGEGDEVLIPKPYYVSYPHMVKLAGGTPVFVTTKKENNFNPTPREINENISKKSKLLILCNPSNPTGAVLNREELKSLVETAVNNQLMILCDEIYEKLIYDSFPFTSITELGRDFKENLIIVNGVSKTYSMTGWRIGYALSTKTIVQGMSKVQSHSTSGASSISQYAALAAISGPQLFIENQLSQIDFLSYIKPKGAFYFFIDIRKILERSSAIKNSIDFCNSLLEKGKVAAVPGIVFGVEGFIRISYARAMEDLEIAMARIKEFISDLK